MATLSPRYITLAELFEQLGQQMFGPDWTGEEISAVEIASYDEALSLRAELRTKEKQLPTPSGLSLRQKRGQWRSSAP